VNHYTFGDFLAGDQFERTQFDHFLDQIDDLKPAVGEPEYRYFYRMATALTAALRVAPSGPDREKVLRQLVALTDRGSAV
jgi:hypothetical protein